jgi:hypothetical protein
MTLLGFHNSPETNMYEEVNLSELNSESIIPAAVTPIPRDTKIDFAENYEPWYGQVSIKSLEIFSNPDLNSAEEINLLRSHDNLNIDLGNNNSHHFSKYSFAN